MEDPSTSDPISLENSSHALNNALVLQMIFRQLAKSGSLQDLKNARLVTNATNWQEEMQKVWRKEAVLVLRDVGVLDAPPKEPHISMINFIREFGNPDSPNELQTVPYERVKLSHSEVNLPLVEEEGQAKSFWDTVGPTVKHLKLKNFGFCFRKSKSQSDAHSVVRFLAEKLPNLETLSVNGVSVQGRLHNRNVNGSQAGVPLLRKVTTLQVSTQRLGLSLSQLPNLQELKLTKDMNLRNLMDYREGSEVEVYSSVKQLEFRHVLPPENLHFSALQTLKTKLPCEETGTNRFIQNHAATLTKLDLFRGIDTYPDANTICSPFTALTEFRASGNVVKDLSFLRFTPNLQTLHLDPYGYEKQREMRKEYKLHRQIEWMEARRNFALLTSQRLIGSVRESGLMAGVELPKLGYLQINCNLDLEDVQTLAQWMPNLKTFKAVLYSPEFQEVCALWSGLEQLECMFGSRLSSSAIAPPRKARSSKDPPYHGLTDLKKLKSFVCLPRCCHSGSVLSNDAVKRGILKLPWLTNLEICVSDKFTEKTEKMCRDRIQNVKIHKWHPIGTEYSSYMRHFRYIYKLDPARGDSDVDGDGYSSDY